MPYMIVILSHIRLRRSYKMMVNLLGQILNPPIGSRSETIFVHNPFNILPISLSEIVLNKNIFDAWVL